MSDFQKSIIIVMGVFLTLLFLSIGYILGTGNDDDVLEQSQKTAQEYSIGELLNDLTVIKAKDPVAEVKKPIVKKTAIAKKKEVVTEKEKAEKALSDKPKLSIIMDDISRKEQLQKLQGLGLNITPSIFPTSELSMKSNELAKGLEHYMIHIPMQYGNVKLDKHYKTLKISDTKKDIIARVKEIRYFFPKALYVNNHTGSVFAANYKAMHTLYEALRKDGFLFLDSKTGAKGQVLKISSEFSDKYVSRDVFIDNEQNVAYTHKQLEKAVKIAKSKGHAIVIGHPHKSTFEALESAKEILKDVELVYLDTIY
jgi:polysaccharide deacetylase 2 family uncharacterized protein YibQ